MSLRPDTAESDQVMGRTSKTRGACVRGVVSCVPSTVVDNAQFESRFGSSAVADVVKMIGVNSRRIVGPDVSAGDLGLAAARRLIQALDWEPGSIDGIIFLSQTPNYRLPATACELHGQLGLSQSAIAFDVNLGCSGYPYALWLAMTIVQSGAARRMLVVLGDTISKVVDPQDRATAMLFGDAGTATAIEGCDPDDPAGAASYLLGTDGTGIGRLIIPSGAFKEFAAPADSPLASRDRTCLYMDGAEIFNFTLRVVPWLVGRTLEHDERQPEEYAAFLFHQANLFMLKHLIKKTKLPADRVPINIDRFGNTSCASIPLLLCTDGETRIRPGLARIAAFGFGVGFSWGSACLDLGGVRVRELIEV
jgi:3-oxoacyl-[acyl-carrier-protein] synthase-3